MACCFREAESNTTLGCPASAIRNFYEYAVLAALALLWLLVVKVCGVKGVKLCKRAGVGEPSERENPGDSYMHMHDATGAEEDGEEGTQQMRPRNTVPPLPSQSRAETQAQLIAFLQRHSRDLLIVRMLPYSSVTSVILRPNYTTITAARLWLGILVDQDPRGLHTPSCARRAQQSDVLHMLSGLGHLAYVPAKHRCRFHRKNLTSLGLWTAFCATVSRSLLPRSKSAGKTCFNTSMHDTCFRHPGDHNAVTNDCIRNTICSGLRMSRMHIMANWAALAPRQRFSETGGRCQNGFRQPKGLLSVSLPAAPVDRFSRCNLNLIYGEGPFCSGCYDSFRRNLHACFSGFSCGILSRLHVER